MRTTVVPAQVTTVEDKIAGNLGLSQLLLLTLPVFGGSALFVALPPFFNYATYKIVVIVCFAVLCGTLAIRIKGKILLLWAMVILRYNLRPRFYVFDRNSEHLRDVSQPVKTEEVTKKAEPEKPVQIFPQLSTTELVQVEHLLTHPNSNLHLKTNSKGKLSVHFTEVE